MNVGLQTQYSHISETCKTISLNVLSDPVQPLKMLWVIGEGFLRSSFGTLQTLRTEAKDSNQENTTSYIYRQYKVKPFYQTSSGNASGALYKLYNSVVNALNKEDQLPEYIIMLPDHDVILHTDYFFPGIGFILERIMNWLGKQLDRALTIRREALWNMCPGAVGPEPKILWVQMIKRPYIHHHPFPAYNLVCELRDKFNAILKLEASKSRYALVLEAPDQVDNARSFDAYGNLTFAGKQKFWRHIDTLICNMECDGRNGPKNDDDTNNFPLQRKNAHSPVSASRSNTQGTRYHQGHTPTKSNPDIWGEAGRISRIRHSKSATK